MNNNKSIFNVMIYFLVISFFLTTHICKSTSNEGRAVVINEISDNLTNSTVDNLSVTPLADTCVFEWYPNKDYGTSKYLYIANLPSDIYGTDHGSKAYTLIKFDLLQVDLSKIVSAKLYIYYGKGKRTVDPAMIEVRVPTFYWDEHTTYSDLFLGEYRPLVGVFQREDTNRDWIYADVTPFIYFDTDGLKGFILSLSKKTKIQPLFHSRETKEKPCLVLTFKKE